MNNQQSGEYYVDLVMCIDGTGSMDPIIEEVKANALDFHNKFTEAMDEAGKEVAELRVKVIVFRDYKCDSEPMTESKFFTLPEENEGFRAFVQSIEAKGGGDIPENAFEAISRAIKSDWVSKPGKKRHVVQVFSDAPALNFGDRADCPSYPSDMPADLAELGAWWQGTDQSFSGSYDPNAGRLVTFVPEDETWTKLATWNRYWPSYSNAGTGLDDVDMQSVIDLVVGSC